MPLTEDERDHYNSDPKALEWAREIVQRRVNHYRKWEAEAKAQGSDTESQWRRVANILEMDFIGGSGCTIAGFDQRKPKFTSILRKKG